MKIIKNFFLDLIAPKKCYSCSKEGHFICKNCLDLELDYNSVCFVCKGKSNRFQVCEECKKNVFYDKVIILKRYNGNIISKLIKDAKFFDKKEIFEEFSRYLFNKFLINEKIICKNDYLIISIPSHFLRKFKRGYNGSEILGKSFARLSGIEFEKKIIKKTKNTLQQSKLGKNERLINLVGAFKIIDKNKNLIKGKKIIVLDDVISTGTTLNEVAKILKAFGAKSIIGIIIASG